MTLISIFVFASYLALETSLSISRGHYSFNALCIAGLGLVSLGTAIYVSCRNNLKRIYFSVPLEWGIILGVIVSLVFGVLYSPIIYWVPGTVKTPFWFFILSTFFLLLLGIRYKQSPRIFLFVFILILFVWLASGFWVLKASPHPKIDVWYIQQGAEETLLNGNNPYEKVFNIPVEKSATYQITDRYVYPPHTLFVTLPFYYFFGDIRYANLFCQWIAGLFLLGIAKRSGKNNFESSLLCILFLFHSRWPFVLEQAWTESTLIVLLFASVFLFLKSYPKKGASLAGLFLAAKPYLLPLIIFYSRFLRKKSMSWFFCALFFALLPFLFILKSPVDFYHNVIAYHFNSEFRFDSLSFSAFLARNFYFFIPSKLPFILLFGVLIAGAMKQEIYQTALFTSFAYFLFFFLYKNAFCNYYFFVSSLIILTLALLPKTPISTPTKF